MVKLFPLFVVGFAYVWALWFNQGDLHSSVVLLSLPLWSVLALRAGSFYALLVFAGWYAPALRLWLRGRVRQLLESEARDV